MEVILRRDSLTPAELRSELEALSQIDLIRLHKRATPLAAGTGMDPDDLLQEAVMRSLKENGGRKCPRNVKPVTFLFNVMRSIASHARENRAREIPLSANEDDEDGPIVNMPDPSPSPEEAVVRQLDCENREKLVAQIVDMFDNDPQVQAVIIGIMEDWAPHQICEMGLMSDKEYVAARKRMRRMPLRKFPKGPTYE